MTDHNDELALACTLEPSAVPARVDEWRSLAATATSVDRGSDGVTLRFPDTVDVAAVARLAAAERACCGFFTFTLSLAPSGVTLAIAAPPQGRSLVDALVPESGVATAAE